MKIAIVRGPFLNQWEMQNYEPLAVRHEVTAFTTTSHVFSLQEIKLPIIKLFSPDKIPSTLISPSIASLFNRAAGKIFGWNYYLFGLEKELRKFDLVNTIELHHVFTNQIIEAKKKYNFKVAVTVWENIPFVWDKHPARREIKRNVIQNADLFIAVTEKIKETLLLEGVKEEKIKVLPMGVDLTKFKPQEKNMDLLAEFGIEKSDLIVLFIGRFVWEKGVCDLIYAAKKLLSNDRMKVPLKILFAGDGPEKEKMAKLIAKLGISDSVKLIKNRPYAQMPDIHNLADIFVIPSIPTESWQEQFGLVLVEAMACGKPVISTLTGSIPEVIGEAGILLPPADYLKLAEAINQLLISPGLRKQFAQKGLQRAREKFNAGKVAREMETMFEK